MNGANLVDWPYLKRKDELCKLLNSAKQQTIHYVYHRFDLEQFFNQVKQQQEEGIILKKTDSPYTETPNSNKRPYDWFKVKNWRQQTCQVVGYTAGKNARSGLFGSLVLIDNQGTFIGCAGSGPNDWELRKIKDILDDSPQIPKPFLIDEPYTAVKTNLRVEIKYYQLTDNKIMRFPIFVRCAN